MAKEDATRTQIDYWKQQSAASIDEGDLERGLAQAITFLEGRVGAFKLARYRVVGERVVNEADGQALKAKIARWLDALL